MELLVLVGRLCPELFSWLLLRRLWEFQAQRLRSVFDYKHITLSRPAAVKKSMSSSSEFKCTTQSKLLFMINLSGILGTPAVSSPAFSWSMYWRTMTVSFVAHGGKAVPHAVTPAFPTRSLHLLSTCPVHPCHILKAFVPHPQSTPCTHRVGPGSIASSLVPLSMSRCSRGSSFRIWLAARVDPIYQLTYYTLLYCK